MKKCNCGETLCCCGRFIERSATSTLDQDHSISQLNINLEIGAIAIATNGGTAKVTQLNCGANRNLRDTSCIATSCETLSCNNICDLPATFSATDQENRQDSQTNIAFFGLNAVTVGAETEIENDCAQLINNIDVVSRTIATNCPIVPAAQPEKLSQDNINTQNSAPENLNSVLNQTPLSSIIVNGKRINNHPQTKSSNIEQIAFKENNSDEDNADKKPLVLNFDKFHVVLNLDGISLDVEADSDGKISVDGKEVRR